MDFKNLKENLKKIAEHINEQPSPLVHSQKSHWTVGLADFLTFKTMLLPLMISIFYVLGCLFCVFFGFYLLCNGILIRGLLMLCLGPLFLHLTLELIMLPFAILDTLRQTRDELRKHTPKE